ncbi:hypothetical protein ACQ4PT_016229 [Festuca glaucescens]
MSSLAIGRGLEDLELWLGGLFTEAELAAADLLLQLSVAVAGGDDKAAESSTATTYSSRRSASPCLEDLDAEPEEEEEVEVEKRVVVEEPAVSTELDRRARKRYRFLSDLYAATGPLASAFASAAASGAKKKKKRKRHHHHGGDDGFGSSSSEEATRYGGDH